MGNMTVSPTQLESYKPASHAGKNFPSNDNWYSKSIESLESGAAGWTPIQLSPTLNMAELEASAKGIPGWTTLAIKQGDKFTIINKGDDGKLSIATDPNGYQPMNEAAHIPGIRSALLNGHASAWKHETEAASKRSVADLNGEIKSLCADRDVIDKDLKALGGAKSSKQFLGSQVGLLTSMRKDLDTRISRLEELRDAAELKDATPATKAVASETVEQKTPSVTTAELGPEPFSESRHQLETLGAWVKKATDLVCRSMGKQAKLDTPEGSKAYQNARNELEAAYASDVRPTLGQGVARARSAPDSDFGIRFNALHDDLGVIRDQLKDLDKAANGEIDKPKPTVKVEQSADVDVDPLFQP